ncbi:MAG: hypothetical protein WBA05_15075 [Gordonia sp. (in: high G+C Gram-positive bacteria)]|uniref:hypothetical protein n=1 Tax=Gordonia TaxID=2053 RepID=UPI00326595D5
MIVSVDIRLASMMSAVTDALMPAVQENPFAFEQAQLLAGHIQALRTQLSHSDEYERLEHEHTRRLARRLVDAASADPASTEAAEALRGIVGEPVPDQIEALRAHHRRLAESIAEFVEAQGVVGTAQAVHESTLIILESERAQSFRDRAFFASFGYDADAGLPAVSDVLADFRATHSTKAGTSQ